jgi:methyl coenzyme M reductase subunit C-like uncharacterized protein (methanogenesis marker protein 7)
MRRIERAAIKLQGTVYSVPRPGRHHDVIRVMVAEHQLPTPICGVQGFILSDETFVDRQDALRIALEAGQVATHHARAMGLDSADVW